MTNTDLWIGLCWGLLIGALITDHSTSGLTITLAILAALCLWLYELLLKINTP